MIKKFNYTNRKKIPANNINISINSVGDRVFFNAVIKKDGLDFPNNARVYIEVYYGPNYLRFDFGEFENLRQPSNTEISEIKRISEKIYFRIKIIDETEENGLILGFADKLKLAGENEPRSKSTILYVNPVKMETNEIWRINFTADGEGIPILEVNNAIEGIKEIAKNDPRFIALVYPSAIRQILLKLADENDFERDGETWASKWIMFTQDTLGVNNTPENNDDEDLVNNWINDVVGAFSFRHKILENYLKNLQ